MESRKIWLMKEINRRGHASLLHCQQTGLAYVSINGKVVLGEERLAVVHALQALVVSGDIQTSDQTVFVPREFADWHNLTNYH